MEAQFGKQRGHAENDPFQMFPAQLWIIFRLKAFAINTFHGPFIMFIAACLEEIQYRIFVSCKIILNELKIGTQGITVVLGFN
jgi:hypothetical protein